MINLSTSRNYIIVKNIKELEVAKQCDICKYIIWEDNNVIYIYTCINNKWVRETYVAFGKDKEKDYETTGYKAYQEFYRYCGKSEIERMKSVYHIMPIWESYEQLHYANIDFMQEKLYQDIYEFDANSAFTYGVLQLPSDFDLLKQYMMELYDKKKNAANKITRNKYKNLQNYLIGYFARIKEFVMLRSEIIRLSNLNILHCMEDINSKGGVVYISNTDSIITNSIGAEVMKSYLGDEVGKFKLETTCDRLYYKSCNIYQLGSKLVYSGVGYFPKRHIDFFRDEYATSTGSLIDGFDFIIDAEDKSYTKICRVRLGQIEVTVTNKIGEVIDKVIYKIGE